MSKPEKKDPGTPKEITGYFHCKQCVEELPKGVSPRDWARNEVGWTKKGIQVWCSRHDTNVVHFDFKKMKIGVIG